MKIAFGNLGLLVLSFVVWVVADYYFTAVGAPLDPDSMWQRILSLGLFFPVTVFVANWYWWCDIAPRTRSAICLGVTCGVAGLSILLIFAIGFPIHLAFGGVE